MKNDQLRVKKKLFLSKWLLFCCVVSALGVFLLPYAERNVAIYRQKQEIRTASSTDSSLNVAKVELGNAVGTLTIPALSLEVPIYEGTSDQVLENGIGITEGTGDIKGGKGKKPLLAGHSGLYKDNLFDDLPSIKKGQKFFIEVNKEKHAYQIDRIEEVEQNELQKNFINYLKPDPEEDQAVLMTCTSNGGLNNYRLLVYGKRVIFHKSDIGKEEKRKIMSKGQLIGVTVFLLVVFRFIYGYQKKTRKGV